MNGNANAPGWMPFLDNCPSCNATGKRQGHWSHSLACGVCHGTGFISYAFTCECGERMTVPNDAIGKIGRCLSCGSTARIAKARLKSIPADFLVEPAGSEESKPLDSMRLMPVIGLDASDQDGAFSAHFCPNCGRPWESEGFVCIHCEFDICEVERLKMETWRTITEMAAAPAKSRLFTIISNKGGVGKTHLAVNLATCLGQCGKRVLLIDADLGNADVQIKVGVFPKLNLLDFLEKRCAISDTIIETEFGFCFIGGVSGDFKLANLLYAQKVKFLTAFRAIAKEFDVIIMDLSAGISRTVLDFALAGDELLLITTPRDIVAGYSCLKAAFFRMQEIERRLSERVAEYEMHTNLTAQIVFNRVRSTRQGILEFNKIERAVAEYVERKGGQFHLDVQHLGALPYDAQQFTQAERLRRPVVAIAPDGAVTRCFRNIAKGLICSPPAGPHQQDSTRRAQRFANFLVDSEHHPMPLHA